MTFLELVQTAVQRSGAHIDPPTTLVGVSGVAELLADFINEAWHHIQMERLDWVFRANAMATATIAAGNDRLIIRPNGLSNVVDFSTVPPTVTAATVDYDFIRWSLFIGPSGTLLDADKLDYVEFSPELFEVNPSDKATGQPNCYTVNQEGEIVFDTVLDQEYRIYMTAPTSPQELSLDADEPSMLPEKYHMGIVWKAIIFYGMYRTDQSLISLGQSMYKPYRKWLESREMPQVSLDQNTLKGTC